MHKRILALICTAVLMSNLVSIENWSMITRAEEQEEQTEEETGSATVTVTTQGGKTAECAVKVTKDVTSITIEQPAEAEFYPAFTDSVQFAAALIPDEEYCNDPTTTWSVNEGSTASIDPSTGELTLHELTGDEETVTVTAEAGNEKTSRQVTLKKAEITEIFVDDIDVTYGKEAQLTATVKFGDETVSEDKMPPLYFEETDGTEIAEVTKEGKVTAREVGAFKVKVSTDGNGYFKSAGSSEKELTIHPAKLQVKVTEGTAEGPIVTKVSDGTTALTTDNITAIENALSLEGIVDDEEVSLKVGDDASWSSLSYEENKLGSNTVSLNSLKDSFELEGTDSANYVLDAEVPAANDLKVTAEIAPKAPETSDYDMTQAKEDQTFALTDDEVSGILLSAGTKGTDEAYWYNEAGLP